LFHEGPVERRKRAVDRAVAAGLLLLTTTVVLPVALILGFLVVRAWPALSWTLITDNPRQYMTAGGLWAPLVGTFVVVLTSLLLAAPLGILAGIYLHEYAADNWRTRLVNLAVLNLAGVPSIVHALFGVGVFVMAAVPYAFRESCWILGASRWQTIRRIVLPNAVSGILTGVILQVSRAAGETAPILFTGAVFYIRTPDHGLSAYLPYGWRDPFMALSYHLFTLATQVRGAPEPLIYATAVLLIALVFAVNAIAIVTRARLRLRRRW
jgi:phosphate transport system permease protein